MCVMLRRVKIFACSLVKLHDLAVELRCEEAVRVRAVQMLIDSLN
jgi:hypothetical protein